MYHNLIFYRMASLLFTFNILRSYSNCSKLKLRIVFSFLEYGLRRDLEIPKIPGLVLMLSYKMVGLCAFFIFISDFFSFGQLSALWFYFYTGACVCFRTNCIKFIIISFFQLIGGIVACRYRNLMDPFASESNKTPFSGSM